MLVQSDMATQRPNPDARLTQNGPNNAPQQGEGETTMTDFLKGASWGAWFVLAGITRRRTVGLRPLRPLQAIGQRQRASRKTTGESLRPALTTTKGDYVSSVMAETSEA